MDTKHSSRSASGAYRWMHCSGQPQLVELLIEKKKIPKYEESSIYAKRGTAAHWVIEQCVDGADPTEYLNVEAPNGIVLDEEDISAVMDFLMFLKEVRATEKFILHSEIKVAVDEIHPLLFGTTDIALVSSDMKKLKIIDYKHGAGVPVNVENNYQLMYYALGTIQKMCKHYGMPIPDIDKWGQVFEEVELIVVQPRCNHKDGSVRRWIAPSERLDLFGAQLLVGCNDTLKPDAPLVAGNWCKWCRAEMYCPAITNKMNEVAKIDFAKPASPVNMNLTDPQDLTPERIAKILRFMPVIDDYLKQVAGYAEKLLEQGETVPGFKLVQKRANRKWIDEAAVIKAVDMIVDSTDDLYSPKKLKSPAQIEKMLPKKQYVFLKSLTEKPNAGTALAPDTDARPQIGNSAALDFERVE